MANFMFGNKSIYYEEYGQGALLVADLRSGVERAVIHKRKNSNRTYQKHKRKN